MELKFKKPESDIDLQELIDFCKKNGKVLEYRKGEQLEREGDPARWFAYVESGCFKYMTRGIENEQNHITWFSFESEFVADYPSVLSGKPSLVTIEAMTPSRVWKVSGEELVGFFSENIKNMELRASIGEHILSQFLSRYLDLHRYTPHERYNQLLCRCPGIVDNLPLNTIASFLNITPQMLSRIRKEESLKVSNNPL